MLLLSEGSIGAHSRTLTAELRAEPAPPRSGGRRHGRDRDHRGDDRPPARPADADPQRLVTTMLGDVLFADFMRQIRATREEYQLTDADMARFGLLTAN